MIEQIYFPYLTALLVLVIFILTLYLVIAPKKVVEKYDSGEVRKKYFIKNGIKVGCEHTFYRDGRLNKVKQYANGVLNGIAITYYPSGAKYIEVIYTDGILVGDYKIFEESGAIKEIKQYSQ